MSKQWNVKIDEQSYDVALKGSYKLLVNGEELKLRKYKKKTGLVHTEYEVPVGTKTALLIVRSMGTPQLVIDNKDCATGEDYVPVKLPVWAYIFIVLHCINILNGVLGVFLAAAGVTITTSLSCNKKMNIAVRVILNLVVLILFWALIFALAFMAAGL
ncbi:MAG: hypothetical protein J6C64_15555 [Lachnospiraceae bacterium]|nr:hypothetical protein [Lachnospiraceae bacterium]